MTPQSDRRDYVVVPARNAGIEQIRAERSRPATSALLLILCAVVVPIAFAFGAAMGSELQILGIVLATIGMMVILARPFYGLVLFVALLYTRPEESIQQLAEMHFTLAVAVITMISMWFRMFMRKERFVHTPFLAMLVAFAAAVIASSVQDDNINDAAQDIARLVILVLLIVNLVREKAQYRQFINALMIFTAYLAGYTMYLYFTGQALQEKVTGNGSATFGRAQGTGIFNDPNDLATTLVAGLALALSNIPSSKKLARLAYILLSGMLIWSVFLTNSRGGMLAMMLVMFGFFFISLKNKKTAIIIGVFSALALLALGSGHMTNFDSQESSANSRFHYWTTGFDDMVERPLLGVGYNGFEATNDGATAHNTYVLCYAETGLIGYFFFMGCLYYCFRRPPKPVGVDPNAPPTEEEKEGSRELLGARLALVGYLAGSFWLSHTYEPVLYVMLPLPIIAQLCWAPKGVNLYQGIKPWPDWKRIAVLALGSIVFIELLADHYK